MSAVIFSLFTKRCQLLKVILSSSNGVNMSSKSRFTDEGPLFHYASPEWAKALAKIPSHRVKIAMLDTPMHRWKLPGVPDNFEIYIKRDDMTGGTLSGNKVRKLEFIFADALQKGCSHFITCGGIQSNYCRAAAVAAAQLGLKTHLVLRAGLESIDDVGCLGNVFLDRLCGADMYLVPRVASYSSELLPRMQQIAHHIKEQTGEASYLSEVGGSDSVGFYGYLEGFRELESQGAIDYFDDIVFTAGSGGTGEGLAAGNYLTGSNVKIHGVAICDDAQFFHQHANKIFGEVGLKDAQAEDMLDIIEGYKGKGYGMATEEDYEFIHEVSQKTGIILDPTYTGKAVRGLIQELHDNPAMFKGNKILFVHTGGIFGAYDGRLDQTLLSAGTKRNNVHVWNKLDQSPF